MAVILLCEAASEERDGLERALAACGHRVVVKPDAAQALSAWQTERHQLAILDDGVRGAGTQLAARLKADTKNGYMPVLVIAEKAGRAAALAVADDAVSRPYDLAEVTARVTALLRTRAIVDELRLARAESEAKTYADATTGLRNRAFLGERIDEEWKRSVRYNEPLSLIIFAVEGLHEFIVQRGVGAGDRLLHAVAAASLRALRQIDVVSRYGPAELAALLPNTHFPGALACAERLRRETATITENKPAISMGISFFPGKDVSDANDLLRMAARALERARDEGPGSICLFQHQGYLFQPK